MSTTAWQIIGSIVFSVCFAGLVLGGIQLWAEHEIKKLDRPMFSETPSSRNEGLALEIAELHRELGIDPMYDPGPYLPPDTPTKPNNRHSRPATKEEST